MKIFHLNPPSHCDIPDCARPIPRTAGSIFYDARDPGTGMWGNFCPKCAKLRGLERPGALGIGRGQRYEWSPQDHKFLQTAGGSGK